MNIDWKDLAITFYFKLNGRRCVECSRPVSKEDAHIEARVDEHFNELYYGLFHKACAGIKEK